MRYDGVVLEYLIPTGRAPVHAMSARAYEFKVRIVAAVADMVNPQLLITLSAERVDRYHAARPGDDAHRQDACGEPKE